MESKVCESLSQMVNVIIIYNLELEILFPVMDKKAWSHNCRFFVQCLSIFLGHGLFSDNTSLKILHLFHNKRMFFSS